MDETVNSYKAAFSQLHFLSRFAIDYVSADLAKLLRNVFPVEMLMRILVVKYLFYKYSMIVE